MKPQILKNAQSTQIVNGLKRTIRELRSDLESKDVEIEQMKRNVNATRINQLVVELETFRQECVRLRGVCETQISGDMRNEKEEVEELRRDLTQHFNERDFARNADHENQVNSLKREIDLLEISN